MGFINFVIVMVTGEFVIKGGVLLSSLWRMYLNA